MDLNNRKMTNHPPSQCMERSIAATRKIKINVDLNFCMQDQNCFTADRKKTKMVSTHSNNSDDTKTAANYYYTLKARRRQIILTATAFR